MSRKLKQFRRAFHPGRSDTCCLALLRIDALVALDRKVDAIDAIERSLSHVSGPKKAELLRLQGDLSAAIGNCEKARAAYRRSLALDPDGASSEAARRGLDRCLDR